MYKRQVYAPHTVTTDMTLTFDLGRHTALVVDVRAVRVPSVYLPVRKIRSTAGHSPSDDLGGYDVSML